VADRAAEDRLVQVASSLTFTTLLSLVPLVTIAMASIASFPAFSPLATQFKIFLLTNMVPEVAGKVITVYMEQFAAAAARLTGFGIAFLGVTAMMLMLTIDNALNAIWRVTRPRALLQRLLIYWAVLTIGPALLGASISMSSWLVSASMGITREMPALGSALLRAGSLLLSVFAFTLLYLVVPNRHVPWWHALTGGVVAAVAFEIMKRGFGFYIANFAAHRLIYGAFASIPIFLLWLYLTWLVVLSGAAIAAALASWRGLETRRALLPGERFIHAMTLLRMLVEAQGTGAGATLPFLSRLTGLPYDEAEGILERLRGARWVDRVPGDGWALVRDADQIRLSDVYRMFVMATPAPRRGVDERLEELLSRIDGSVEVDLGMTLRQFLGGSPKDTTAPVQAEGGVVKFLERRSE
jgi:membrane protein